MHILGRRIRRWFRRSPVNLVTVPDAERLVPAQIVIKVVITGGWSVPLAAEPMAART